MSEEFHIAKQALENALVGFVKASDEDDRDLRDELDECLFTAGIDIKEAL